MTVRQKLILVLFASVLQAVFYKFYKLLAYKRFPPHNPSILVDLNGA